MGSRQVAGRSMLIVIELGCEVSLGVTLEKMYREEQFFNGSRN